MDCIRETAEIFICDCSSREHQIIFQYDLDDNLVYCSIHLTKLSFWGRLKYLFGYQCRYGAFEEFIWKGEDAEKLLELSKILKKNKR